MYKIFLYKKKYKIFYYFIVEPIVIPQSLIVEALLNSLARLVCNVESWPRPLVTWFFNELELFDSNLYATVSFFLLILFNIFKL